jgi:hypothetical protein
MFTRGFWTQALERATKTSAQVALLAIGTNQVEWTSLDAEKIIMTSAVGFIVSVLMSIGSLKVGTPDDPSAV